MCPNEKPNVSHFEPSVPRMWIIPWSPLKKILPFHTGRENKINWLFSIFFFIQLSTKENCSKCNTTARCFLHSCEITDGGFSDYCNYSTTTPSDSGSILFTRIRNSLRFVFLVWWIEGTFSLLHGQFSIVNTTKETIPYWEVVRNVAFIGF